MTNVIKIKQIINYNYLKLSKKWFSQYTNLKCMIYHNKKIFCWRHITLFFLILIVNDSIFNQQYTKEFDETPEESLDNDVFIND